MNSDFEIKDNEKTPMAPTVSIEQIAVVRPIKIAALLCAMGGVFLNVLSYSATTWVRGEQMRAGLWESCIYVTDDKIQCSESPSSDWLEACRVLSGLSLGTCFLSLIIVSVGLTTNIFSRKYKYYVIGMVFLIIAGLTEITSLIVYPVMFSEDGGQNVRSWGMGWAYGLGWIAAISMTVGSVLLYMDKNADELVYKEKTSYNDSIEESPDA